MLVLAAAWLGMTDSRCPTLFATRPERLQAAWHEERQLTAAGPSMAEVFCLCSLSVCRSPSLPQGPEGGAEAGTASCSAAAEEEAGGAWGYEVLVQQDMDDGRDHGHEEAHAVATLRLQVWLCPPVFPAACTTTASGKAMSLGARCSGREAALCTWQACTALATAAAHCQAGWL